MISPNYVFMKCEFWYLINTSSITCDKTGYTDTEVFVMTDTAKKKIKTYAFLIVTTETVGALSGLITREGTKIYSESVRKPPLSPPAIVFPIVWSVLYAVMAVAAARVWLAPESKSRTLGIRLYVIQLVFNFFWSLIFFNLQYFGIAFFWLLALDALIAAAAAVFYRVDKPAAYMMIPYMIWVTFAGYLNAGVWILNG